MEKTEKLVKQEALIAQLGFLFPKLDVLKLERRTVLQNIEDGKILNAPAVIWRTFDNPFEIIRTIERAKINGLAGVHIQQQVYITAFAITAQEGENIDTNFETKIETCFTFELE